MAKGIKTGGRSAGTPNKVSKEFRNVLSGIIENEINSIPEILKNLDPKDRLEIIIKLMPYVIPKLESVSFENETQNKVSIMNITVVDEETKRNLERLFEDAQNGV